MPTRLSAALVSIVLITAACGADEAENSAPAASTSTITTTATEGPSTTSPATTTTTSPPSTSTAVDPPSGECVRVADFDATDWFIVNDGVMGGRSDAAGAIDDGVLAWTGTIVTDGGGFSSIRGRVDGELDGAAELALRIRTDGRAYELLADDSASTRVTHYNPIPATGDGWETVTVPLDGMESRIFGSLVTADPFDPDRATQIGVILADGLDGDFAFEIDWIDACA